MFRLSNCLFLLFNLVALISGLFAIGSSLYFQNHGVTECHKFVYIQLMVMGTVLLVISLIGLIGTCCKCTCLLWIYSFVAFLILVGLTLFSLIVYVVKNPSANESFSGLGFKEYGLGDFSLWLKKTVADGRKWNGVKSCLIKDKVCNNLYDNNVVVRKAEDFFRLPLSPIESGCCKPPVHCDFKFENATFWVVPESGPPLVDSDCQKWSNEQDKLCFDCKSCKAGVLETTRMTWKIFAILDIIDIAIALVIFGLSFCARRNILIDKKFQRGQA